MSNGREVGDLCGVDGGKLIAAIKRTHEGASGLIGGGPSGWYVYTITHLTCKTCSLRYEAAKAGQTLNALLSREARAFKNPDARPEACPACSVKLGTFQIGQDDEGYDYCPECLAIHWRHPPPRDYEAERFIEGIFGPRSGGNRSRD